MMNIIEALEDVQFIQGTAKSAKPYEVIRGKEMEGLKISSIKKGKLDIAEAQRVKNAFRFMARSFGLLTENTGEHNTLRIESVKCEKLNPFTPFNVDFESATLNEDLRKVGIVIIPMYTDSIDLIDLVYFKKRNGVAVKIN